MPHHSAAVAMGPLQFDRLLRFFVTQTKMVLRPVLVRPALPVRPVWRRSPHVFLIASRFLFCAAQEARRGSSRGTHPGGRCVFCQPPFPQKALLSFQAAPLPRPACRCCPLQVPCPPYSAPTARMPLIVATGVSVRVKSLPRGASSSCKWALPCATNELCCFFRFSPPLVPVCGCVRGLPPNPTPGCLVQPVVLAW